LEIKRMGKDCDSVLNIQKFCEILFVWAGLVLCQGYVPEKHHTNQTQNSHLKQCISWGLGD